MGWIGYVYRIEIKVRIIKNYKKPHAELNETAMKGDVQKSVSQTLRVTVNRNIF